MLEIILGIILFTGLVLLLTVIILLLRSWLVPGGTVDLVINDTRTVPAPAGETLLGVLTRAGFLLPSTCGGKGTCGQCKITVLAGGGPLRPTESSHLSRREAANDVRLACQVMIKDAMQLTVPESILGLKYRDCTVRSNRNVATFIKELVLELPPGDVMDFNAGAYIQVRCPPYRAAFRDFRIEAQYEKEWDRHHLWRYQAGTDEPVIRAYSMANYPEEGGIIMLNVRIATPPPGSDPSIPPGVVSSYLFSLKPGDKVTLSGPYGNFNARPGDSEMVFIGGGAGMAPIRSHILDQLQRLKSTRRISYWYGARSRQELFYRELFNELQLQHPNFTWHIALSDPLPEDNWTGDTGFIHQVVHDNYLSGHPAPEDCEYYICGPPAMNAAVIKMLEDLGVERENIMVDDFGG